jgi:hypothetical protein
MSSLATIGIEMLGISTKKTRKLVLISYRALQHPLHLLFLWWWRELKQQKQTGKTLLLLPLEKMVSLAASEAPLLVVMLLLREQLCLHMGCLLSRSKASLVIACLVPSQSFSERVLRVLDRFSR